MTDTSTHTHNLTLSHEQLVVIIHALHELPAKHSLPVIRVIEEQLKVGPAPANA